MRVIIADDHQLVREGLSLMLSTEPEIEVVGEVGDGIELLELLKRVGTDIVLLDIAMPEMDGLEALGQIRAVDANAKVIVLTMHDDSALVRRAIELGASGYLLKNSDRGELMRALHRVSAGDLHIQAEASGRLLKQLTANEEDAPHLSPREVEVLRLAARGSENKQIATELQISETTVKTHLARVFEKLGVGSRTEAVAVALRLDYID